MVAATRTAIAARPRAEVRLRDLGVRHVSPLLIAVGAIVRLPALILPAAWPEWIRFLLGHRDQDPTLPYRVALAWLLAVVFARRGPRWLLVPLMVLASPPTLAIGEYATLFAAVPRLRAQGARA